MQKMYLFKSLWFLRIIKLIIIKNKNKNKMLTFPDFKEKQIVFIDWWELKEISLRNDNLMIYEKEKILDEKTWKEVEKKKLKNQITCFKIFSIFIIWNFTITSNLHLTALENVYFDFFQKSKYTILNRSAYCLTSKKFWKNFLAVDNNKKTWQLLNFNFFLK